MIVVMLGTQNNSFYRLIDEIENLRKKNIIDINEEIIIQKGHTKYEKSNFSKNENGISNITVFDFLTTKQLDEYIEKANLVITHAGVRFNYI